MIVEKNIIVAPKFDAGDYMNEFIIASASEKDSYYAENMQTKFKLSFKDFDILSALILSVVEEYIENKTKEEENDKI